MALSETQTYDRCLKLLEFAQSHRIIGIPLILSWKRWHQHGTRQMESSLTKSTFTCRDASNPVPIRPRRGHIQALIGSDVDFVLTSRRWGLNATQASPPPQLALLLDKLQDPIVTAIFKAKVEGKFIALSLVDCNEDTLVENIKEVLLLLTTQEVLYRQSKSLWRQEGLGEKKGKPEAARTGLGASTGPQRRKRHCVASKKPTNYWRP